jgi:uncharacterized protein (DUF2062 family)
MNTRRRPSWRRSLARHLPHPSTLAARPWVRRWLGFALHPASWALRRRTVAMGAAIGAVICVVPLPGQAFVAAAAAGLMRANVPVAVAITWLSNPLTFAPILGAAWTLGALALGQPMPDVGSWMDEGAWSALQEIWQPLLLGMVLLAAGLGLATYAAVTLSWRGWVLWTLRKRRSASSSLKCS